LVVLELGKVKDGVREFLVLEIGKLWLSCSPFFQGLFQCAELRFGYASKFLAKKVLFRVSGTASDRLDDADLVVER
jgi:hypothetical protein